MARAEANPTPTLLIWARDSSGLTIDDAAKKARVAAERLAAWESGEQKPTFAQLRKLGVIYRRPLAIFYLADPPRRFEPMHDFRRAIEPTGLPQSPTVGGATVAILQGTLMVIVCLIAGFRPTSVTALPLGLLFMLLVAIVFVAIGVSIGSSLQNVVVSSVQVLEF